MNIQLRKATEADFPQIVELFREFAAFEQVPHLMVNSAERMSQEKELFHCFIAETDDKKLAGYVTYFFTYHTWVGKCMYIDDLYVKDAYRKQGIGKALLFSVIEYAKKENCHKLKWQVSGWNTNAQEFYKSIGTEIASAQWNCSLSLK